MGRKAKKPKQIEEIKNTYTCPICGKEHKNKDICPVVLGRRKKVKFDSQSYLMSGILLECLERNVNFFYVLKEMAYLMEMASLNDNIVRLSFNADFIISYFGSVLGCAPSKFFKRRTELSEKYIKYIGFTYIDTYDVSSVVDENNNITEIDMKLNIDTGTLGEMLDTQSCKLNQYGPDVRLHKVFGNGRPTYYLRLEFGWFRKRIKEVNNKSHNVHFDNLCFSEHSFAYGFDLCAEKEGKLKELFEKNIDWTVIAREHSCTSFAAEDWITELEQATKKGLLDWYIHKGKYCISCSTTYGYSEIEIQIAYDDPEAYSDDIYCADTVGDCIYINENDRKMYHYGETGYDSEFSASSSIGEKKMPNIVKIPMIRKLGVTISRWDKLYQNKDYVDTYNKKEIKKKDVLSVTYSFVCANKGHLVTPYCGLIKLLTPEGEEIEEKVYLGYCRECNVYYIFKRDYEYICTKGKPQCKVIDASTKKVISDALFEFNSKSILSEMGYNVQASSSLTDEERQNILKRAIEEKKISENEILNLLELQIHLHSGDAKYANAVEKWKRDSAFVKSYGIESDRIKRISSIEI